LRVANTAVVWQACGTDSFEAPGVTPYSDLVGQLRAVVRGAPTTESELRKLLTEADGWGRTLQAQIGGSERRLNSLTREPAPRLAEVTAELRRIDSLRPQLKEVRRLLVDLELRARELRASWLSDLR
jgi:hypothetical protein